MGASEGEQMEGLILRVRYQSEPLNITNYNYKIGSRVPYASLSYNKIC